MNHEKKNSDGGLPNRGAGRGEGGSDTWEKLPNNPIFFFEVLPNQDTAQPEGTFLSVIFTGGEKG